MSELAVRPVVFRPLQPGEIDAAVKFAVQGLRAYRRPELLVSHDKIRAVVEHFALQRGRGTDFHLAAFVGEHIVGGIAVAVSESLWFERCDATIVMFRASVPHVGTSLLQAFRTWLARQIHVKRVFWPLEDDAPRAMARYARMHGFRAHQLCVLHT